MDDAAARAALDALIRERREDYAGLSRLLGRNAAYLQQYVKRGSPRRLHERDRMMLTRYFGVDDAVLGGPAPADRRKDGMQRGRVREADLVAVPRLEVAASAGPGTAVDGERATAEMMFAAHLLRDLGVGRANALSLIRVEGDSMLPTLTHGDDILVDRDDAASRLRDGVYVIRIAEALLVKRIALKPNGRVAVRSDNRLSPSIADAAPGQLAVIGRVVWSGGRVR